ncbi:uncharacterized protein LOC143563925 [Bidens hawaiensis]|uniref:uncharacterized protein LOC143563925 n=1 Tax=Bidens hawaiensis TaxID=980011 RepID=UPI004048EC07
MKGYGFRQSNSDHTLFLKNRGNDDEEMKKLKESLFKEFEMKDLGRLKYFLGIEVLRSKKAETGMIDCKPADTPMMVNHKLHMEEGGELANKERYQRLTGQETKMMEDQTSGYFTLLGGNLVTWRSKKQKVVALSSAEAEF